MIFARSGRRMTRHGREYGERMNDSTWEFLLWLGIPDKMTGFELLGETLEQSMEYVRKGRKINQTDIFISLSKRHGQSYNSIDRAIRRAVDFAAYRTDETAKRNLCEVMGNVYYGSVSVKSFLYAAAGWLLLREDME